MGATLAQLARGIHGAVTREDAKKLAKLHGHKWKALLKRMKRTPGGRPGPSLLDRVIADVQQNDLNADINAVATSGLVISDAVEVQRGG